MTDVDHRTPSKGLAAFQLRDAGISTRGKRCTSSAGRLFTIPARRRSRLGLPPAVGHSGGYPGHSSTSTTTVANRKTLTAYQAANSGAREIPSAMMTTPYAALISDPTLFASAKTVDVRSRNRRFFYIVVFWSGAFSGAALSFRAGIFIATVAVLLCKTVALGLLASAQGSSPTTISRYDTDPGPDLTSVETSAPESRQSGR